MLVSSASENRQHQDLISLQFLLALVKYAQKEDIVRLDHHNKRHVKEDFSTQTKVVKQYSTVNSAPEVNSAMVKHFLQLQATVLPVGIAYQALLWKSNTQHNRDTMQNQVGIMKKDVPLQLTTLCGTLMYVSLVQKAFTAPISELAIMPLHVQKGSGVLRGLIIQHNVSSVPTIQQLMQLESKIVYLVQ